MSDDGTVYCLCGTEMEWQDCETCGGDGFDGHDCGEDSCCCLDPDEPNLPCGVCATTGGWWVCGNDDDATKEHGRGAAKGEGRR